MVLISHRGNISGSSRYENHPHYVTKALDKGYSCEVDVWYENGQWRLGHEKPLHQVSTSFLKNNKLWCHAKNLNSLHKMLENDIHCFWHQSDDFTLTSKQIIMTYPDKELTEKSVCIDLNAEKKYDNIYGICSDNISKYR